MSPSSTLSTEALPPPHDEGFSLRPLRFEVDPEAALPTWFKLLTAGVVAWQVGAFTWAYLHGTELPWGEMMSVLGGGAMGVAGFLGFGKLFDMRTYLRLERDTLAWRRSPWDEREIDLAGLRGLEIGLLEVHLLTREPKPIRLKLDFLGYSQLRLVKAWLGDYLRRHPDVALGYAAGPRSGQTR